MALKLRKDIKKSSYYVWFLGAKESKGLRGTEYILPVIKHLEERERDIEPFKVTLQVSHKGLKIIQNVISNGKKNKNETIKHFIPHNTITCVYQDEDVIACILLLFNPVTKCPLHVHAYRCDSLETATLLKQQIQTLIERPENQRKFSEIESRLKPVKEAKKVESSIGSETGTSTRESVSSEERFVVENSRVSSLYDSVAAELRQKLSKNNVPILLPPRDYDTVHRQKGNLTGIELRRCLNTSIVGQNVKGRRIESSGGSSGIGSDHPPSPESPDATGNRFNHLDNQSTSDEDWTGETPESTMYLMPTHARHQDESRFSRYPDKTNREITKYLEKPIVKYTDNKFLTRQKSLERQKSSGSKHFDDDYDRKEKPMKYFEDDGFDEGIRYKGQSSRYDFEEENVRYHRQMPVPKTRQKCPNFEFAHPPPTKENTSPRDRFKDAKEKFQSMEKEGVREAPISPITKNFVKRHESMAFNSRPKPAPRSFSEEVRFREMPLERYRHDDPKRRSMFSLLEEEHRKNSSEIAKELKRRSYIDVSRDKNYNFSKSTAELDQVPEMRYSQKSSRHSYAENKMKLEASLKKQELLHRTNSITTSGRVGIASLHY